MGRQRHRGARPPSSVEFLMPTRRAVLQWSASIAAGLYAGLPVRLARAALNHDSLAVVVAKDSPLHQLSHFELKKLYMGSPVVDPSGERIVPFNQMPKSPDRIAFDSR